MKQTGYIVANKTNRLHCSQWNKQATL